MSALATIAKRRAQAADAFAGAKIPTRRTEDWKYTDLSRFVDGTTLSDGASASWKIDTIPAGVELVDLADDTLPDWVEHHLGTTDNAAMPALASLGFAKGGFALRVPAGVDGGTVRVRISGAGSLRALVLVEKNAKLNLHETSESGNGWRNVGLEVLACPGAEIAHLHIGENAPDAIQYESIEVLLKSGAHYRAHYANFGAKLSRLDLHAVLAEADAGVAVTGVSVVSGATHADVTTHIEHAASGRSTQLFKYVVGGTAKAVYQGRITVRPGADGTDSRQTAKALLLSERAEADLKPELLIFAEDVKCAHGAAVGDLDEEALYYLNSRGLGDTEARDLLIRAFLGEAVDEILSDSERDEIWQRVEAALPKAMEKSA